MTLPKYSPHDVLNYVIDLDIANPGHSTDDWPLPMFRGWVEESPDIRGVMLWINMVKYREGVTWFREKVAEYLGDDNINVVWPADPSLSWLCVTSDATAIHLLLGDLVIRPEKFEEWASNHGNQ